MGVQEIKFANRGKPVISPESIINFKDHEGEIITVLAELGRVKDDAWFISGVEAQKSGIVEVSAASIKELKNLKETLAILGDNELMQAITKGKEDIKSGRVRKFTELLQEYGLE